MDTIKAILHGTTKEEEKAKKEEKKAEQHGTSTTGEGSHLGNTTNTSNTQHTNPLPGGVSSNAGGLGQNTMKSNYDSTPTDGPITTHGRHAEREATLGAGGVDVPHRPRDSEVPAGQTSGLSGVGNGSNVTGPNTQVHGINSPTGTSNAGLASQNARDPLSSGTGNPHHSDTVSGLGSATSMPSGNTLNNPTGNTGTSGHHYGRDAAVAGGAAGLAHHEHGKHEHTGVGSNTNTGLGSNTTHTGLGSNTTTGLGSNTTGTSSGHHLGRDAAAVGTAGAVGEGIHHHNQHNQHGIGSGIGGVSGPHSTATANRLDPNLHGGASIEDAHTHHGHQGTRHNIEGGGAEEADGFHGATGTSADPRVVGKGEFDSKHGLGGSTTAGPHSSNLANKADPRVDSDLSKTQGHHYGRDAAIAGGVGAAGAGAYGAREHNTTAGPHSSNLANKGDPRVDSDLSKTQGHHYGRDAAIAGGAGGAAYEADKHLGSHNTHGTHNTNTTTAGPHSSNLANKADPRVDSDLSKTQGHHYGRDAAIAGGAGGAAYEADKHLGSHNTHGTHNTNTNTTTAGPHSSNLANKADPRVDSDRSKEGHHYGRDAAVAGGAGGAAYEANKHLGHNDTTRTTGATPLDQKPLGKDLGDKLHGTERNRGVSGDTGFPHQQEGHHHGSTGNSNFGAVGTGVPGAPRADLRKNDHHHDNTSNTHHGHHDTTKAPDHLFTAPVVNDEPTRFDGTHNIAETGESIPPRGHDHHTHGDVKGKSALDRDINAAPLGNTETTPGSGLRDHHTSTTGSGLASGTHNTTGSGLTSGTHTHGTHGIQSEGERLAGNTGTTGSGLGNSGRVL